jgi:phage-related protein
MVVSGGGGSSVKGAVAEQDIKKKRETTGMIVDKTTVTTANAIPKTTTGARDAMPSWCGIFTFWALNKSGVPMPKWKLGERMIKPESARPPGMLPMPGDIAYRNAYSHYAIVESATGNTVKTVNGNTAGEDNLGGQVQTKEHPLTEWTAFFNPLLLMTGSLGTGEGAAVEEKPKTLKELRKELFNVSRKEENDHESSNDDNETSVQAKTELSNWSVNGDGGLHNNNSQPKTETEELQKKEEGHQEEEKTISPKIHTLQRKGCGECEADTEKQQHVSTPAASSVIIQNKEIANSGDSSLTTGNTIARSAEMQSRGPPVQLRNNGNSIQCGWFDDALSFVDSAIDFVAEGLEAGKRLLLNEARDFVMAIPGYKALRVVLGEDPITGEEIERNGHNFIEAAFDIMPGGNLLYDKLNELGALTEAEAWIDRGIAGLEALVHNVVSRVETFWNGLTLESLASPTQIFEDAGNIIHSTISEIVDFAVNAATELLEIVKRWLLTQVVDFIKEHTTAYPLLCVILGEDPITHTPVLRNGSTILSAILELGGEEGIQQRTQMQETGTFQKAADWIDRGIGVFSNLLETITNNFGLIWSVVSIDALMHPIDKFNEIYNTFAQPVADVLKFMADVAIVILEFIKEALMQRLSAWAKTQRGYYLVTLIIGKDPFTDKKVPFTMENVIHGFMSLMDGGEEQFAQMKESGAIDRTTAKITAAVEKLNMTPEYIVQLFTDLWESFSLNDLADPIAAFQRIIDRFGEPIGRLIAFVIEIIKIVIVVILEIMNFPFDLINNIIAKAMLAFDLIKKDPIGFLKNLLRAIKEGFMQFFDNILTHLFNGLKVWFLGEVQAAGIPIPTDFTVMGIIKWLLAVLDITMEKIWKKLEERIGKPKVDKIKKMIDTAERVASAAGEAYEFMKEVQERGFMAVMIDKVKEQLSNVWEMVLGAVQNFVMEQIVNKVTVKLLSMLDPTGIMAVVNSAIALYKAIQSFIKYLRQMLEIVNSFVEGTLQIAQGATKKAADFLEGALASGIPIVIGFLANQVGLNLSERLKDALEFVREKVDKGLTWVIDKLVTLIEKLVTMGKAAVDKVLSLLGLKKLFRLPNGEEHTLKFSSDSPSAELMIESTPTPLQHHIGTLRSKYTSGDAVTQIGVIDGHITNINTLKKETMTQSRGEEIGGKLNSIAVCLQHPCFGGNENIPPSRVTFSPTTKAGGTVGHVMDANPLTLQPGTNNVGGTNSGSEPAAAGETELWHKVRVRTNTYIQGHLLNHHVHGSGALKENLVPIRGPYNSQMERDFESIVKNRVLGNREILHYRVEAVFGGQPGRANLIEESDLPTALKFTMKSMQKKNATVTGLEPDHWEEVPGAPNLYGASNPFVHTLEPDSPPAMAATLPLADLMTEAASSKLSFEAFRSQNAIHIRSVDAITVAAEIDALKKIFTDRDRLNDKAAESKRVSDMKNAEDITSWTSFMGGRTFYKATSPPDAVADAMVVTVKNEFDDKQLRLRSDAITAANAAAKIAPAGAFAGQNWVQFKVANNINFRTDVLSEINSISAIETIFRSKQ